MGDNTIRAANLALSKRKIREVAQMAEDALPRAIERALILMDTCTSDNCGHGADAHGAMDSETGRRDTRGICTKMCGCQSFKWGVTLNETLGMVRELSALSRHEKRMDNDLGLDKREVQEQVAWLVGIDISEFKRMTAEQRERVVLAQAGRVVDVPKIESDPATP